MKFTPRIPHHTFSTETSQPDAVHKPHTYISRKRTKSLLMTITLHRVKYLNVE